MSNLQTSPPPETRLRVASGPDWSSLRVWAPSQVVQAVSGPGRRGPFRTSSPLRAVGTQHSQDLQWFAPGLDQLQPWPGARMRLNGRALHCTIQGGVNGHRALATRQPADGAETLPSGPRKPTAATDLQSSPPPETRLRAGSSPD